MKSHSDGGPTGVGTRSVNSLVRVALTRSILVVIRQTVSLEAGREGSLTLPICLGLVAGTDAVETWLAESNSGT